MAESWDDDHRVTCRDFGIVNTARDSPILVDEVAWGDRNDVGEEGSSVVVDGVDTRAEEGMVLRSSVVVEEEDHDGDERLEEDTLHDGLLAAVVEPMLLDGIG